MLNELALFAGAGGGLLGSELIGLHTRCAIEIDPYCRRVLLARQRDGYLPRFPIWDDIRTFKGTGWKGHIDVITGGFPCTDISPAGKRKGLAGDGSGLFFQMLRIIAEVQPSFVFAENSSNLRTNGLGAVIKALAGLGYMGRVGILGARHVGANHQRNRMWIVAYADNGGEREQPIDVKMEKTPKNENASVRQQSRRRSGTEGQKETISGVSDWWHFSRFTGVDDGDSHRMDRVRATGNMQVPRVAQIAWEVLST